MAKSAFQRMKEENRGGNGGDYLVGGDLAAEQIPFGISRIRLDEGGGYKGADRWLLSVYAYYEGDDLTNGQETGLLSLSTGSRDNFMAAIQEQLKKTKKNIEPVVLVKLKTKNGNKFLDLVEWDPDTESPLLEGEEEDDEEDEAPAPPPSRARRGSAPGKVAVTARRRAVEAPPEEEEPEEEEPAPRPTRGRAARSPEPEPVRRRAGARRSTAPVASDEPEEEPDDEPEEEEAQPRRPFVVPAEEEASELRRDARAAVTVADIREWAIDNNYDVKVKGKLPQGVVDAFWNEYDGPREDYEGEQADEPAAKPVVTKPRRAEPPQGARKGERGVVAADGTPLTPNAGPSAQEIVYTPGAIGRSIDKCPQCDQYQEGQMFPSMEGGKPAIIHVCNGSPQVLFAAPMEREA